MDEKTQLFHISAESNREKKIYKNYENLFYLLKYIIWIK